MTIEKIAVTLDSADDAGAFFARGSCRVFLNARIPVPGGGPLLEVAPARGRFDGSGTTTVELYPNDLLPGDTQYTIYYDGTPGNPQSWSFTLVSTDGDVKLSDLAAVPSVAAPLQAVPLPPGGAPAAGKIWVSDGGGYTGHWADPDTAEGTVTSVNEVAPVSGNVTLVAADVGAASTGALTSEAATRASADTALGNSITALANEAGQPSGLATLDSGGHVPAGQLANALPTLAQASASASATLVVNTVTTVTAATALTMTLPASVTGALIVVERESASAASVAVTGNIRGVAAQTVTLSLSSESEMFLGYGGSWWPVAGHKTLGSLDARYAPITEVVQAQRVTTTSDLSTQVLAASTPPAFTSILATGPNDVVVDPGETYQQFLGVGAALTDSAAYVLANYMTPTQRTALLTELFSPSQFGWSMLRVCMGSSDFRSESSVYTYDDMPGGQTDTPLNNFSVARDTAFIVPVLQQILAVNPGVRIVACPWTPPGWMLASGTPGNAPETLNDSYMSYYAQYFVAFIQAYQALGIPIWGLTPQNEPNTPTWLTLTQSESATFINTYLGPALAAAGLGNVRIFGWDNSWGDSNALTYTQYVLANAPQFTTGIAWHGYGGTPTLMSQVHGAYPGAVQIQTEWRSLAAESAAVQMGGMAGGYVAAGAQNWSSAFVLWNLALDQNGNPNQGSPGRLGAVTVNNGTGAVTVNAGGYAITHLGKFARPGARRCMSTTFGAAYQAYVTYPSAVTTCAWVNPDGSVVLYAYNGSGSSVTFQVIDRRSGTGFPVTMVSGELSTFTWGTSVTLLPSVPASVPAAPAAPALTATGGPGETRLSWTVPSSAAPVDYYLIGRSATSGTETLLVQVPVTVTSYTDITGASGTWYYTVTAVSAGGPGAASTEKSATATSPAAPAAPVISAQSAGASVILSWTAPDPNGAVVASFNILRGTSSGGETSLGTANQGATGYTDSTGSAGTTYYYKVQAVNSAGTSASSNEVTGNPTGVVFDAASSASQSSGSTLAWSHVIGSGVHRFLLVAVGYAANSSGGGLSNVLLGSTGGNRLLSAQPSPGAGTDKSLDVWYWVNPPSGSQTITVDVTSGVTTSLVCGAASYSGVSQSGPVRTPQKFTSTSSNAPTVSTTGGAATDLVLAALHARVSTTVTPGGGQTSLVGLDQSGSANNWLQITSQGGGTGTITSSFSWSAADMAAEIAVALAAG